MRLPWNDIVARHTNKFVKLEEIKFTESSEQLIESAVVVATSTEMMSCTPKQKVVRATPFQAVFWV